MIDLIITTLIVSLILVSIATWLIINTFNSYYSGIGFNIIFAYAVILVYLILEIIINRTENYDDALVFSKISSGVLGMAFFLLHYFHDEVSAVYRQRKTMTLASIFFGIVVGGAWVENAVRLKGINGHFVPLLNPFYGLIIVIQGSLLVFRITENSMLLGELSEHYGIDAAVPKEFRKSLQRTLYAFQITSLIGFLVISDLVSTPFSIIIAIGALGLAIMYSHDPLSSLPIAQALQAIALVRDNKIKFVHVFSQSGETIAHQEDFASIMTSLGELYKEIMKSKSTLSSISTNDTLVMFENSGDDYVVLILEHRAPLVRRILKSAVNVIIKKNPQTSEEFSEIVNKNILFRTNDR